MRLLMFVKLAAMAPYAGWLLFMLAVLPTLATAKNYLQDASKCGQPVCKDDTKFAYMPNTAYTYKYSADISTELDGAEANSSVLHIDAEFELRFVSSCEAVLLISSASLSDNPIHYNVTAKEEDGDFFGGSYGSTGDDIDDENSLEFHDALIQYPLRFYMESGTISEICPHDDEKVWTLNFKRGLLSSFQNTMVRLDRNHRAVERDVNGECLTKYRLDRVNGTTLIVNKEKDMANCMKRYSLHSVLPTPEYVFQSKYHHYTPLESSVVCQQSVDHRVMTSLECNELHAFEPLRVARTHRLVRTSTAHRITLVNEQLYSSYGAGGQNKQVVNRRETLLFQHERQSKTDKKIMALAENHLKNLCEMGADFNSFRMDLADELRRVVYSMRQLDDHDLQRLALRADEICTSGRKHFLQSIPYVQTQASIKVMKDILLSDDDLSPISTSHWLFTMALFPRPDRLVMQSMAKIVLSGRYGVEATLATSAVMYSYCGVARSCRPDIDKDDSVATLLATFEKEALLACRNDLKGNVSQALVSLKALGNAAIVTPTLLTTLAHCIHKETDRPDIELRLRIAAVEAHRRLSCDVDRNHLLSVYLDQSEDAQLRIAAYIQAMQCPSYSLVKTVVKALQDEQVNQVGSYVWSHLTNLAKSSMPARVEVQALLQDEELAQMFSSDLRSFSQNLETSVYINEYGLGGFLSGNVIYSPKSYVPRTVMLNFTAFLFGEPINLMEVTLDAEGVEQLIEKSFRGGVPPLLNPSLASLFSSSPFNLMRFVRSVTSSALKDYIAALPDFISANFRNTKASIGVKVFGHELAYAAVDNREQLNALLETVDPLRIIKDFLSGQEMKLDRMSMLVDSTYVAPLSLGLPLQLNACASAALKLTLAGFVNTTSFTSHGHLDVDGKLRPSIALSGMGSMWVDAHYARTEARLQGRFVSSSALEGSLSVKGNKFVRLSFDLPMHKADLISAETRLVSVRGNQEHIHFGTADQQLMEECSWPLLDEMLALRVCTKVRMPTPNQLINAPLLLLRQPLEFALSLEKSDATAKRYTFLYTVVEQPADNRTVMSAVFETPGALINRTVRAEVAYSQHIYNISLLVQSQNNRLSAQGRYVRLPLDRSLVFGLDINGKKHVDIEVSFKSIEGKYGYTHYPKLDFQINGKSVAHLDGTLKWVEKKGIAQCDVALNFRTQRFEASAHGYIRVNDASFAANIALDYQFVGQSAGPNHQLRVEVKLGDRSTKRVQRVFGGLQLESSAYPHINLILNVKLLRAQEHVEYIADLQTNPPPVVGERGVASTQSATEGGVAQAPSGVSAQASFSSFRTFVGHKTSTFVELRKPDAGLDLKLGYAHEQRLHTDSNHVIVVRYAQGKEITVALDLKMPPGSMLYFEGQLKINLPAAQHPFIVAALIHEKTRHEYDLDMSGAWFSGHNVTVRGHYSDRSTVAVTSHTLKLLLMAPQLLDSDWSLAARIHATDQQRKLDLQAAQGVLHTGLSQSGSTATGGTAVYELRLENQYEPEVSLEIGGEIRLNTSLYTLWSHVDLAERRLTLDMHLDRSRDVRVDAWAWRNLSSMLIGGAVRWDANRDPTQFVAVDLKSVATTPSGGNQSNHYDAQLMLEYPGRRLDGVLKMRSIDTEFKGEGKLSWSQKDAINANVYLKFDPRNTGIILLNSEILTPFEMWERTSFTYGLWLTGGGKVRCNATLDWMRSEWCVLDVQAGYQLTDQLTQLGVEASLNSSSPDVSQLLLKATHAQSSGRYDTLLVVQSSSAHQMRIWSGAELLSGGGGSAAVGASVVTGGVRLNTPFATLQRGHLEYTLKAQTGNKVAGHFSFNVNDKTYTAHFKGAMRSLYEAGVTAQLSTPYAAYSILRAQAGYSTYKRRLLAEVRREEGVANAAGVSAGMASAGVGVASAAGGVASGGGGTGGVATGLELICRLDDVYDFNVKVHLYTGFTVATDLLLVANIDPERVDMRCGWNGVSMGVSGVAHMGDNTKQRWYTVNSPWYTDLDYSAMLYLPVEHYARTGAAVRLQYTDRLDVLGRLEAADKRLGVKAQAMVWPEEGFARITSFSSPSSSSSSSSSSFVAAVMGDDKFSTRQQESEMEDADSRLVIWRGVVEVDTVIYNTSSAILELDRRLKEENKHTRYNVQAAAELPFVSIKISDSLLIQNVVNVSNVLFVSTTHRWLKQATLIYDASGQLASQLMKPSSQLAKPNNQLVNQLMGSSRRFNATLNATLVTGSSQMPLNFSLGVNYTHSAMSGGAVWWSPLGIGSHRLQLASHTPMLGSARLEAGYTLDEATLEGRLLVDVNKSLVDVSGTLVTDASAAFINTTLALQIRSPHFDLPVCRVGLEKDFTQVERKVKAYVVLPPAASSEGNGTAGTELRRYEATGGWHVSTHFLQLNAALQTPDIAALESQLQYNYDQMSDEYYVDAQGRLMSHDTGRMSHGKQMSHDNRRMSQDTRLRLTARVAAALGTVDVTCTSSIDGLRAVRLRGRMLNDNATSADSGAIQRFEAELGESGSLRVEGWLTREPPRLEMRLIQAEPEAGSGKPEVAPKPELVSVSVRIAGVQGKSLQFAALVQQLDDRVDITGDLETLVDQSRRFKLKTTTTYKGYEGVEVSGRLASLDITTHDLTSFDITTDAAIITNITRHELMLEGATNTEWLTTQFKWQSKAELAAIKEDLSRVGVMEVDLKATQLSASAQLHWLWMWLTDIRLKGIASYTFKDLVKKDVHTELIMWNPNPNLSNTTLKTDISFNNKSWWLATNASLIKPTNHAFSFKIDMLPPQNATTKELYTVQAKLDYLPDYTAFSHLLRYSTRSSKACYETESNVALADNTQTAVIVFKDASLYNSTNFYFNDSFVAEKTLDTSRIYNVLSTSLLEANLETNLTYQKVDGVKHNLKTGLVGEIDGKSVNDNASNLGKTSKDDANLRKISTDEPNLTKSIPIHVVSCQLFYPHPKTILDTYVKFQDVNNMFAKLNSSTPFKNVSHISAVVRAETGEMLLHRYGEVLWSNNSAYINYVHNVKFEKDVKVLNGLADVVFPLATKHYATLLYKIDNIEKDGKVFSNGTSTLLYNNSSLVLANFTQEEAQGGNFIEGFYDMRLINADLPLNLKYYHTHESWPTTEKGDKEEVLAEKEEAEAVLAGKLDENGKFLAGKSVEENILAGTSGGTAEFLAGERDGSKAGLAGRSVNGKFLAGKSAGNDDFLAGNQKLLSKDRKQVVVYRDGEVARNFSGVLEVSRYRDDTRYYSVAAKHTARDIFVDLWLTDRRRRFTSSGQFVLKPQFWFRYGLTGINKDTVDQDGRRFELDLAYPERDFGLTGEYKLIERLLTADVQVRSNRTGKREKRFGGKLLWKTFKTVGKHSVQVLLDHPQFEQPVRVVGNFSHNETRWFDVRGSVAYSVDKRRMLALDGFMDNLSSGFKKWYILVARVRHPATRLSLAMDGSLISESGVALAAKNISYKRSYLPLQYWNASAILDRPQTSLVVRRQSLRDLAQMAVRYRELRPRVYRINSTLVKGKDLHLTGDWLLDVPHRETQASVNLTSVNDATSEHRLRLIGWYRDKRHAHARVWRESGPVTTSSAQDTNQAAASLSPGSNQAGSAFSTSSGNKAGVTSPSGGSGEQDDVMLDARLNHSRMLTASARWRTDIRSDVAGSVQAAWDYVWVYATQTVDFWTEYMRSEALETWTDVWRDAKPIVQEFVLDVADVKNFTQDFNYFKRNLDEAFEANEFYLHDAYNVYLSMVEEMSFQDRVGSLPKIVAELWQVLGETGETIRQSLVWTIESVRVSYEKLSAVVMRVTRGDVMATLTQFMSKVTAKYDRVVKDVHISLMSSIDKLWRDTGEFLHSHWSRALQYAEPTVIRLVHYVDSMAWEQSRRLFELFDRSQTELLQSDYFAKNTNLTRDLERLYKNITSNTLAANIQMYSSYMLGLLNDKLVVQVPFGRELTQVAGEIYGEVLELGKLPLVNVTVETARQAAYRAVSVYRALDVEQRLRQALPALYRRATELARSALDNEMRNHKPKTLFLFSPEKGFVKLEQKLPMPWHAFNETPNFQEIAEYKRLAGLQSWFNPTNASTSLLWKIYHAYLPLLDSSNWLPPFRAQALLMIGQLRVVTFNGRGLSLLGGRGLSYGGRGYGMDVCAAHALLAADFVDHDFQLVLATLTDNRRQLVLMAGGSTVTVDMTRQTVSVIGGVMGGGRRLPIDVGSLAVVQERGVATVTGRRGFQLRCTFQHGVCVFTLEGWYYGKTAGLLGTMDSERSNDLTTAQGHVTADWREFVDSWQLGVGEMCHRGYPTSTVGNTAQQATPSQRQAKCAALFASKESEYSRCYNTVEAGFYHRSCLGRYDDDDTDDWHDLDDDAYCAAAIAYAEACARANTPIKVPATCVRCRFSEGTELSEADPPVELSAAGAMSSSDVVLVVEAGACTRALNSRKQLQQLAAAVDDELTRVQLVRNRFAVVSFGGVGVYAEPRLMTVDGMDFTTARLLHEHLAHLPSESGPRADVLDALRYTFSLQYRAGVSRTLIVALCSDCAPQNSSLDFSTLRQMMADRAITLHLLMDNEFSVEKARAVKTLYGLDAEKAYTKNDFKQLQGDADLRKQIKLTKTTLGNCLPLAIETNGTLFTGRKLDLTSPGNNVQQVRKFLNVFARRIALTARPPACQRCECVSDAGGVASFGGGVASLGGGVAAFGGGGVASLAGGMAMLGGGVASFAGGVPSFGGGLGVPSFDCYSCAMPSPFSASPTTFQSTFGFRNNFTEAFLQSVTSDGEDMDFEDGI